MASRPRRSDLLSLDATLVLDEAAARLLADWFTLGDRALAEFAAAFAGDVPSTAPLWPEHFDLAITAAGVSYGCSPGDEHVAGPYTYVGPYGGPPGGTGSPNASFGATRLLGEITTVEQALEFLVVGRTRLHPA